MFRPTRVARPLLLVATAFFAASLHAEVAVTIFGPAPFKNSPATPQPTTATFAAPCIAGAHHFLVVTDSRREISSATVELNGARLLTERDFPLAVARRIPFDALPSNVLTVTIKGGKRDAALTVSIEREGSCGTQITIDTPANNALVSDRHLLVSGIASGAHDLAISINGVPAQYDLSAAGTPADPFRWFATLSVAAGPLTLTATASAPGATTATATRTINFAPAAETIVIRTGAASGVVPLTTTVDVSTNVHGAIARWELDLDGDGVYEQSSATMPANTTTTYTTSGARTIRARATAADGRVFTASAVVVAQSFPAADAIVRASWTRFTAALAAGDVSAAVQQIADEKQAKYRPALEALGTGLPAYAAAIADIRPIWIHGNVAHYLIVKPEQGSVYGYHVYFVRDARGNWRVLQF